jgi:hypothetical protein
VNIHHPEKIVVMRIDKEGRHGSKLLKNSLAGMVID